MTFGTSLADDFEPTGDPVIFYLNGLYGTQSAAENQVSRVRSLFPENRVELAYVSFSIGDYLRGYFRGRRD